MMKGHPSLVRWSRFAAGVALAIVFALATALAAQAQEKPNLLVIFGDDVGVTNISAYSGGLMGYETPNIDRIAKEGVLFQHYYGEQSCTAGRAAFVTGQHGIRTGQIYGAMDEVFQFAATFKEFPPRSFPPSFVPTTVMQQTLDDIRAARKNAK